jgi:hypothetical protein
MKPTSYIQEVTGLSLDILFDPITPLVKLASDANGVVSITSWTVPNVVQPTPAQIATAMAAPEPSPAQSLLIAYAQARQQTLLAAGITVNLGASGQAAVPVLCDGTYPTMTDLALLGLWGQANPTGSKSWVDNNRVATVLTGAQFVMLATIVGNWVQSTYPDLLDIVNEITVQPPGITTYAAIDAARIGVVVTS